MNKQEELEQMNVVVVGHVDHGKSTLIGRLMADTNALPQGKLEQVRATCARNAKPFEYAFLLDALKDEQSQGITIDTARCFFKTARRRYILIDAPGHIEFLKNMITGAARAEAAFLLIDAGEGIQENSRRHGYIMSMLGIRQICVLVNKMDLAGYDRGAFDRLCAEYESFLRRLDIHPIRFIPISAMKGLNVALDGKTEMPWYEGPTVLEQLDALERPASLRELPFRFPVQDIYKFTEGGDDRRIFAGTVLTGSVRVGDEVSFYPSGKRSSIRSVEAFHAAPRSGASAGDAAGFTLATQLYVRPGELMARDDQPPPIVGRRFRANLFWMGRAPMIQGKTYKLKIGAAQGSLKLVEVLSVLDAADFVSEHSKQQVDRHDVAECVLEAYRPVAFDQVGQVLHTGRFVVVDDYEIAGAGIALEKLDDSESTVSQHVQAREFAWEGGRVTAADRAEMYGHASKFVLLTGEDAGALATLAGSIEQALFRSGFKAYCARSANVARGLDADIRLRADMRDEQVRRLGELARLLTDSGQIFITSLSNADEYDVRTLELLNSPHEILVVRLGGTADASIPAHLTLPAGTDPETGVEAVRKLLMEKKVILDYQI
ncbi:MAG TPA: adenylyl-sulfate kinase [Verrucomicrobia bacterium]|nr:MAG: adenylyl-sulfate kinase [Lentisphaerae bacterium GWF2_57_35]HBA83794.1 adenylyl-sulfate kinase [Verrucomicrobiota bacterium]